MRLPVKLHGSIACVNGKATVLKMFKNTYDPFVTPQSIKHDTIECKYSVIIKGYHYVFFGNGNNFLIPVFWVTTLLICLIAEGILGSGNITPQAFIFDMAILIEMSANVYFGYYFCKHHQMARMILYYEEKYCLDKNLAMTYFNNISAIFLIGVLLVIVALLLEQYISNFVLFPSDDNTILLIVGFGMVSTIVMDFLAIGSSVYLCIIWCLQLWIIYFCTEKYFDKLLTLNINNSNSHHSDLESNHVVHSPFSSIDIPHNVTEPNNKSLMMVSLTATTISHQQQQKQDTTTIKGTQFPQQLIEQSILTYLEEMQKISQLWHVNHLIRTISGLVLVSYMSVQFYQSLSIPGDFVDPLLFGFIAILYYAFIWITALSTGYVNDSFFEYLLEKLTKLYAYYPEVDDCLDKRINSVMERVKTLREISGVRFAGVSMSFEKAVSVGSIIASVILFCINFYASGSI